MSDLANIDQDVIVTSTDMELLDAVDEWLMKATLIGDPTVALREGRKLRKSMQLRGVALAKLLSKLHKQWWQFELAGINEDFYVLTGIETGLSIQTIKKYKGMWESIFDNPNIGEDVKVRLMGKPIKSLLLLTKAAEDQELDWNKVVNANTHNEVREIVNSNRTSSTSRITIYLHKDGTLTAMQNGTVLPIGFLNVTSTAEIVIKAIQRLIDRAGVAEQ